MLTDDFTSVIYAWGNNDRAQLGLGLAYEKVKKPRLMPFVQFTVSKIACGISHTLCLTNQGLVFHWGHYYLNAEHGQKEQYGVAKTPKLVESLAQRVTIDIAAGSGHSLAVTNNKELYSWGSGKFGELGIYNCKYVNIQHATKVDFNGAV